MRIARFAAMVFAFLPFAATSVAEIDRGDSLSQARQTGEAVVRVLYVPADGWAYRDSSGKLTGVTIEIMRRFAAYVEETRSIALELEFVEEQDWSTFYKRIRDGQGGVFGLGNVTITDQRRQELAFSPPYVDNVAVLITHEDVAEAVSPDELPTVFSGLDALAFAGTLHETRLESLREEHWPELAIDRTGSNETIIENVAAGGHFAYIDAYNYYRARDDGAPLRHHSAFDDGGESFGIIMPFGNDWRRFLGEFFESELISTPGYRLLLESHLGAGVAALVEPD